MGTCEHCRKRPATIIEKGPMIWNPGGRGLWRPKKEVCMDCAKLPTDQVWPIVHPNDCRQKSAAK